MAELAGYVWGRCFSLHRVAAEGGRGVEENRAPAEHMQAIPCKQCKVGRRAILSESVDAQGPQPPIPKEVGDGGESGANISGMSEDRRMITGDDEMATGVFAVRQKEWRLAHPRRLGSVYIEIAASSLCAPNMEQTPIDGPNLVAALGSYHMTAHRLQEL